MARGEAVNRQLQFEEIWRDLVQALRGREYVETLGLSVKNRLLSVDSMAVVVESERTGRERSLPKELFRPYVDHLLRHGSLNYVTDIPRRAWIGVGAVISALLATLPSVSYQTRPIVLTMSHSRSGIG